MPASARGQPGCSPCDGRACCRRRSPTLLPHRRPQRAARRAKTTGNCRRSVCAGITPAPGLGAPGGRRGAGAGGAPPGPGTHRPRTGDTGPCLDPHRGRTTSPSGTCAGGGCCRERGAASSPCWRSPPLGVTAAGAALTLLGIAVFTWRSRPLGGTRSSCGTVCAQPPPYAQPSPARRPPPDRPHRPAPRTCSPARRTAARGPAADSRGHRPAPGDAGCRSFPAGNSPTEISRLTVGRVTPQVGRLLHGQPRRSGTGTGVMLGPCSAAGP